MEDVKRKLKKILKNLEKIRGRHTELVTIYVPSGYDLNSIKNQVAQERGTAQNIKSKTQPSSGEQPSIRLLIWFLFMIKISNF